MDGTGGPDAQVLCGPLRGTRDAYLSQLVILDEFRPVPVDQGIEGKTVLPAEGGKAKVMRRPMHCNGVRKGPGHPQQ